MCLAFTNAPHKTIRISIRHLTKASRGDRFPYIMTVKCPKASLNQPMDDMHASSDESGALPFAHTK